LVISPYTKANSVDHTVTSQPSILKFIEQNWKTGTIGDGSLDRTVNSISSLFDFSDAQKREVLLNPSTGAVAQTVALKGNGEPKNHQGDNGKGENGKGDKK
ncbi:MAG: hypothetical protein FWF16_13325, partial [Microbacteriaceae bacterium]|nr:hypothetical protein [Microbacteriaceae bacterium]